MILLSRLCLSLSEHTYLHIMNDWNTTVAKNSPSSRTYWELFNIIDEQCSQMMLSEAMLHASDDQLCDDLINKIMNQRLWVRFIRKTACIFYLLERHWYSRHHSMKQPQDWSRRIVWYRIIPNYVRRGWGVDEECHKLSNALLHYIIGGILVTNLAEVLVNVTTFLFAVVDIITGNHMIWHGMQQDAFPPLLLGYVNDRMTVEQPVDGMDVVQRKARSEYALGCKSDPEIDWIFHFKYYQ